jgi:hypothetical protein
VLVTDGIRSDFDRALRTDEPAARQAEWILGHHALPTDDALALVVRYVGGGE